MATVDLVGAVAGLQRARTMSRSTSRAQETNVMGDKGPGSKGGGKKPKGGPKPVVKK
jgi:hypothetical protein